MGYEIGVTEVGPAEYPLLEVLRETIFGEVGHRSLTPFADLLDGRKDVLLLIAHLEGNPIGFKVGCADRPGVYFSRSGGVLKDYRRQGLARRMQDWQEQFAIARGYKQVFFNTFNHFPHMIQFGLATGFRPVAAEWRELSVMSFKFVKDLVPAATPMLMSHNPAPPLSAPQVEVDHRDADRLRSFVAQGYQLRGIRQDVSADRVLVLLEKPV
jgi:GNAT superfamily N-acetyltransferase